ncbi:hypothetical protein FA95DRAFT_1610911 [Auriscalpium vulgare]|uniref:Uncharacterized protein n=1 Tax=Auriscalpium vulgare TaxID=40419 RepID=A0ACB8RD09_9AGAM|nr:hypothetical protein FA95DRAFT_1610911 [Auriscalpium vulgare]
MAFNHYRSHRGWGSQQYRFGAPPHPSFEPQASWTGLHYYTAHAPDPDPALYDFAVSRIPGAGGVGLYEARHWHRLVYGGLAGIVHRSPAELGYAAAYEAFRATIHHEGIYDPLDGDDAREADALIALAIGEATHLAREAPRGDPYARQTTAEAAAATAALIASQARDLRDLGPEYYRARSRGGGALGDAYAEDDSLMMRRAGGGRGRSVSPMPGMYGSEGGYSEERYGRGGSGEERYGRGGSGEERYGRGGFGEERYGRERYGEGARYGGGGLGSSAFDSGRTYGGGIGIGGMGGGGPYNSSSFGGGSMNGGSPLLGVPRRARAVSLSPGGFAPQVVRQGGSDYGGGGGGAAYSGFGGGGGMGSSGGAYGGAAGMGMPGGAAPGMGMPGSAYGGGGGYGAPAAFGASMPGAYGAGAPGGYGASAPGLYGGGATGAYGTSAPGGYALSGGSASPYGAGTSAYGYAGGAYGAQQQGMVQGQPGQTIVIERPRRKHQHRHGRRKHHRPRVDGYETSY